MVEANKGWIIRPLNKKDAIPYDLLLLADETIAAINKYIHHSSIYVLEQENKKIAIYVLYHLSSKEVEIKNIAVRKEYQGQGIGKYLLEHAAIEAKEMGYKSIIIGTGNAGIKQLYLYQKAGFEIFDIKHNFFLDNYPEPIFENNIQLKHMILLRKNI